jgi:SAM-dependent methyltransferase
VTVPDPSPGGAARSATSQAFFDDLYQRDPDPWRFATDPYEQGRYDRIVGCLQGRRFARGFEPGCSVGVLTRRLGAHCDHLLAVDLSPVAVAAARRRCADLANVEVRQGRLPEDLPDAPLDLVVLSEVGYYLEAGALATMLDELATRLAPGGLVVAAHWTGTSPDHVLSGHQVHAALDACAGLGRHDAAAPVGYLLATYGAR